MTARRVCARAVWRLAVSFLFFFCLRLDWMQQPRECACVPACGRGESLLCVEREQGRTATCQGLLPSLRLLSTPEQEKAVAEQRCDRHARSVCARGFQAAQRFRVVSLKALIWAGSLLSRGAPLLVPRPLVCSAGILQQRTLRR